MNRVLVIDDDRELCSLVGECLAEEDLVVESVHDGKQGLERSLSGKYDIVVLDVVLPGLGGTHTGGSSPAQTWDTGIRLLDSGTDRTRRRSVRRGNAHLPPER